MTEESNDQKYGKNIIFDYIKVKYKDNPNTYKGYYYKESEKYAIFRTEYIDWQFVNIFEKVEIISWLEWRDIKIYD